MDCWVKAYEFHYLCNSTTWMNWTQAVLMFYVTLREDLDYLDGKHTVLGEIVEGLVHWKGLMKLMWMKKGDHIRIKQIYILHDPLEDPPELAGLISDASPEGKPKNEVDDEVRLEDDWVLVDDQMDIEELEEVI